MKTIKQLLAVLCIVLMAWWFIGPKTAIGVAIVYVCFICLAKVLGECMKHKSHGGM